MYLEGILFVFLQAAGEACLRRQDAVLEGIVQYLQLQEGNAHDVPLLVHKVKYDETPLYVRGGYGHGPVHDHKARVYIVTEAWTMHVRYKPPLPPWCRLLKDSYLTLHGTFSPRICIGQSGTGETIAKVVQGSLHVPGLVGTLPKQIVQVTETDECAANNRCEQIRANPAIANLHIPCSGHKTHAVAQKVWHLWHPLHIAVLKTLNFMRAPGIYQKFLDACIAYIGEPDTVKVEYAPLSTEAITHRKLMLELFSPLYVDQPHVYVSLQYVIESLWNGDWRLQDGIHHHCKWTGCCRDRADTIKKLQSTLPKLLGWLRVRKLVAEDWQGWPGHLFFLGLLMNMHGLFQKVFTHTFSKRQQSVPSWSAWRSLEAEHATQGEGGAVEDAAELAKVLQVALEWLGGRAPELPLLLVRLSLRPQPGLMRKLLASTSAQFDLKQSIENPGQHILGGGVRQA